jgi:hypothetical protein
MWRSSRRCTGWGAAREFRFSSAESTSVEDTASGYRGSASKIIDGTVRWSSSVGEGECEFVESCTNHKLIGKPATGLDHR